ncbi:Ger(x)C family spore germination protein [Bacillus sp. 31A1R]|uniref:Ger(X)C family spore germination protein n=1 Tax=Robertmurraya mangrovi TaxID=3098077 RepID=A0ABU5J3R7_9BACI|nr:Ger(x)C family spore germination protein [Bacillus sp. 31A1R]MDZ5474038.1 Ger(x)C family spore germination protein [Bacillus sp. 31A1R]
MNRKLLVIISLATLILAGCWDRVELNDVSIVSGLAVDPGEEKRYMVTIEIVNAPPFSKQGGGDSAPVITFTLEGDTMAEILQRMNIGVTRQLIFSHTRVLFISEEIARQGVIGFLEYLERSGEFRNDFNILITRGKPARDFLKITYPLQKIPSMKVHKQIQTFVKEWGGDPNIRLTDFVSAITSQGRTPVTGSVILKGDVNKGATNENNTNLEPKALVEMEGIAVFDNEKLKGFLTLEESRNYFWTQELEETTLSIPCDDGEEEGENYNALKVVHTHSKINVEYRGSQPVVKVQVNADTELLTTQCRKDLTQLQTYKEYERDAGKYVAENIRNTIIKVQDEFGVDIYGFGEALHRSDNKKYKQVKDDWNEEFRRADVEVDVDIFLRRSGIRTKSFLTDLPKTEENE